MIVVVHLVLTRLEHALRRSHAALRWLGFGLLVIPFVGAGVGAIQAQAAYLAALRSGSSWSDAFVKGWQFLQGNSLEDWAPALVAAIVLLALTATRLRLFPPAATLVLGVLLILSPLVEWPPLPAESLSVAWILAGVIPLGVLLGFVGDVIEAAIESRARRDEGRLPRQVMALREELVANLRRGELPWSEAPVREALSDHEALHDLT